MKPFQLTQLAFTDYLRRGDAGTPRGRRQEIYRDSVYKNISQAVADMFPVTKRVIQEPRWDLMMREFISECTLRTPYLHEMGEEFLAYLMHVRKPLATDEPSIVEVAHFEWIQFALYIADAHLPERQDAAAPTENSLWRASPLAVGLTYSYPVHMLDEHGLPTRRDHGPNHLLVYRNRNDDVEVLATDSLSLRMVQLLQAHEGITHLQQYQRLAGELGAHSQDLVLARMQDILASLADREVLFYQ
ncbi:DNA-binding domain-containing protein [Roseateles sp. LYH14W]|uniref:DUF2063 domain-containing protein n=1 Tax=Pelomonas parva TaxID=3299032 RepID=A0ABW7F5A3_9BURK